MEKYTLNLDKNNFILSIAHSENDSVELDISKINLRYLGAYQLLDGNVVLNEERKVELVNEEERINKDKEIETLKQYLIETSDTANDFVEELLSLDNPLTFVSDFVGLIKSYRETYKTILNQRKQARQRIKELESLTSET